LRLKITAREKDVRVTCLELKSDRQISPLLAGHVTPCLKTSDVNDT